jgi:hypothetical protein
MTKIKELLFTATGVAVTLLHVAFFVGIVTCTVGFKVYVLGEDPAAISTQVKRK